MCKFIAISLSFLFLFASVASAFAKCPETSVHEEVQKNRNEYMKEVYDDAILSPDETRKTSDCLGGIESMGNIFSMGVSLPSMDSVFDQLCGKIDSALQETINSTLNKVTNPIDSNPIFDVVGNPNDMVNNIINGLK